MVPEISTHHTWGQQQAQLVVLQRNRDQPLKTSHLAPVRIVYHQTWGGAEVAELLRIIRDVAKDYAVEEIWCDKYTSPLLDYHIDGVRICQAPRGQEPFHAAIRRLAPNGIHTRS